MNRLIKMKKTKIHFVSFESVVVTLKWFLMFLLLIINSNLSAQVTLAIDKDIAYRYYKSSEILASDIPGETVSTFDRTLSWNTNDLSIPGNGLPIHVGRTYASIGSQSNIASTYKELGSAWRLNVPRIDITAWEHGASILFDCNVGNVKAYTVANLGKGFKPIARNDSNISYPTSTLVHFDNNWLLLCENYNTRSNTTDGAGGFSPQERTNGITLISPTGTKYRFSFFSQATIEYSQSTAHILNTTDLLSYYVTDIEDIHGNYLTFDYTKIILGDRNNLMQLNKISSNDSREVFLNYENNLLKEIKYGSRIISYEYISPIVDGLTYNLLKKISYPEGKSWEIEWGYNTITTSTPIIKYYDMDSIKTPWGVVVSYDYNVFANWDVCESTLSTWSAAANVIGVEARTVTDATNTYLFTYQSELTNSEVITTITSPSNKKIVTSLCYKLDDENKNNGNIAKSGSISRYQLFQKNSDLSYTLLRDKSYEYDVEFYGDDPLNMTGEQIKGITMVGVRLSPHRLLSKKTIIDTKFITAQLVNNKFGQPTKILEANTSLLKFKYKTLGYIHDVNNWIINLPTTTAISDDDLDYTIMSENTYHNATTSNGVYAGLGLLFEEKLYSAWEKRYIEYHADGNIKEVEFNNKLMKEDGSFSDANRYQSFSNYKRGLAQTIAFPSRYSDSTQIVTTQTVDDNGWVVERVDFNGNSTIYGYDLLGRVTYVDHTDATWVDTLFSWTSDPENNSILKIEHCKLNVDKSDCNADGSLKTVTNTFDGFMRQVLTKETDNSSNISRFQAFEYDVDNNMIFSSYPSLSGTTTEGIYKQFDALDRLLTTTVSGGGESSNIYLAENKIKTIDFEGNQTITSYLSYGQPIYEYPIKIELPESVTISLAYDILENVESVTQTGLGKEGFGMVTQVENRVYDSKKRLCLVKRNDVGNKAFGYNALGEIQWMEQGVAGGTMCPSKGSNAVSYTQDNLGDNWKTDYPDSSSDITSQLDNVGNLKVLTAGGVVQSYNYNSLQLLEDETLTIDGKTLTFDYNYNAAGHLSDLTYPDGDNVSYTPNAFGQPTKALRNRDNYSYASNVSYYSNGSIDSFTFGNGLVHKTTLNSRRVPFSIQDSLGASKATHLSYTYDNNLNIKSLTNNIDNSYSLTNLNYDGLGRLISTIGNGGIGSSSLTYDGLGNITSYNSKNSMLDYFYDTTNNRLDSVTGTGSASKNYDFSGGYDNRGNVTNNGTRGFVYNLANQMVNSGANTYVYDGYNRRVKQIDSSGTSYSMYSQSGKLLYRENNVNTSTNIGEGVNYIFLGSKLIAKDGLVAVKENKRSHYKPFGETIEPGKDDVGYTGHKFDKDLGLSYMQARYYDPVIGRFYSNDPLGVRDVYSFNRYVYANNNPYKYKDPNGESATLAFCFGGPVGCAIGVGLTILAVDHGVRNTREALRNRRSNKPIWNESSEDTRTVDDLETIHDPDHPQNDPDIGDLSDGDLEESLKDPKNGDKVRVKGDKVYDGNTRVNEWKKRGLDGSMEIPVDVIPNPTVDPSDPLGGYER